MMYILNNISEESYLNFMDIVNSKCGDLPEDLKKKICLYLYCSILNFSAVSAIKDSKNESRSIDISLDIISKLNLKDKNFQVTPTPNFLAVDDATGLNNAYETLTFQTSVNAEMGKSEDVYLKVIVNKISDFINFKLKRYDTICLYSLCSQILTIKHEINPITKICVRSRLRFLDEIEGFDNLLYTINSDNTINTINSTGLTKSTTADGRDFYINETTGVAIEALTEDQILQKINELESRSVEIQDTIEKMRVSLFTV